METEHYNPGEDKQKFKEKFLENETKDLVPVIQELEARGDKGEAGGIGNTIQWIKEAQRIDKLRIESKILDYKNWLTPEQRDKKLETNLEKNEVLRDDLNDSSKSTIAKQKIKDIEQENRILYAIKESNF